MSQEEKDPKPVFHLGENFSSAFFGKLPDQVSGAKNPSDDQKLISNFISLLTDPTKRLERLEALAILRNSNAQQFLVDLLGLKQYENHRKELLAACWESGLDFSNHLIFFVNLVVNCEYLEALEAITVIDEMHNLKDSPDKKKAIELLSSGLLPTDKQLLAQATIERLRSIS